MMPTKTLTLALMTACSSSETKPDAPTPPSPDYTERTSLMLPGQLSSIDAVAISDSHQLFVASGAVVLNADAANLTSLTPYVNLADANITQVKVLQPLPGGGLAIVSSDRVAITNAAGSITSNVTYKSAFTGGLFGGPAVAISPDGTQLFELEGGSGSTGSDGVAAIHVARFNVTTTSPLTATEVFALAPFEIVPSTTSAINASAPVVSLDGSTLYVAHVVLRTVYAVPVAAPHTVVPVNTDSLQRSATAMSIARNNVLSQIAVFDQTVPVFKLENQTTAHLLTEIPIGLSPGAVVTDGSRVFVSMSSGMGGFTPPPGDAGTTIPGDGGFTIPDGGLPSNDAGAMPSMIRVFDLEVSL